MLDIDRDQINIKDLSFEAPKKSVETFDPREITEERWTWIVSELKTDREDRSRADSGVCEFITQAMLVHLLSPEKTTQLGIDEGLLIRVKKRLAKGNNGPVDAAGKSWEPFNALTALKIFYPEQFPDICLELAITPEDLFEESLGYAGYSPSALLSREIRSRICFPDYNHQPDYDLWLLEKEAFEYANLNSEWLRLAGIGAILRMGFPDAFNRLVFRPEVWAGARAGLASYNGFVERFLTNAVDLTILAAESVEITGNGLEIVMPERKDDFTRPELALPIRRNF